MRLKVAGRAGMVSVKRANAGQESRGGCLALTGNVGWVGCDGCTSLVAAGVITVVTAWGGRDLESSGLGRLDRSSSSRARRTSLSWLHGNHLGVESTCSGGGSSLEDHVR
jgi:hypothetical protein